MKSSCIPRWLLGVAVASFAFLRAFAQTPDLATAKFQYESSIASLHGQEIADRKELGDKYTNVLNSLKGQAQGAGDLDGVKYILGALDQFSKSGKVPAASERVGETASGRIGADLTKLFEAMGANLRTVDARTAREVLKLAAEYDKTLLDLQSSLTREGKIELALAVKEERASVNASAEVVAAREVINAGQRIPASAYAVPPPQKKTDAPAVAASTLHSSAATGPRVASVGGGGLAQKLVGTAWPLPKMKSLPEEGAVIELLKDGKLERYWVKPPDGGRDLVNWKMRDDGVVVLRPFLNQKVVFLLRVEGDLRSGTLEHGDGAITPVKRMPSR